MCEENINLNTFLLNEIEVNKKEMWSKLNNSLKIVKLKQYIEESLKSKYELNDIEEESAKSYIIGLLERKIITKNNDVVYNKESETLEKVNNLYFNENSRKFFYKKEKRPRLQQHYENNRKRTTHHKNDVNVLKKKKIDLIIKLINMLYVNLNHHSQWTQTKTSKI